MLVVSEQAQHTTSRGRRPILETNYVCDPHPDNPSESTTGPKTQLERVDALGPTEVSGRERGLVDLEDWLPPPSECGCGGGHVGGGGGATLEVWSRRWPRWTAEVF